MVSFYFKTATYNSYPHEDNLIVPETKETFLGSLAYPNVEYVSTELWELKTLRVPAHGKLGLIHLKC